MPRTNSLYSCLQLRNSDINEIYQHILHMQQLCVKHRFMQLIDI